MRSGFYTCPNLILLNPNTNQTPLPVQLLNFTFNVIEKNVKLKWSTSSEINNSGFDVERAE